MYRNRERLSLACEGKWAVPGPPPTGDPLAVDQTLRLVRLWGNFSWWECKMAQGQGRAIWPFLSGFFQMWLQSGLHTAALWEVAQGWKPSSPLIGDLANSMQWSPVQLCKEKKPPACLFRKASQVHHWWHFALRCLCMKWKMSILINLCKETI